MIKCADCGQVWDPGQADDCPFCKERLINEAKEKERKTAESSHIEAVSNLRQKIAYVKEHGGSQERITALMKELEELENAKP